MTAGRVLIIGGDSLIGGALAGQLSALGRTVTVTTRRAKPIKDPGLRLDLSTPPETWPALPDADAWVICAGTTKASQCRSDPDGSYRINVLASSALARAAVAQNAHVLFLSTNQVFDGTIPRRPADDRPCPISEYGRQKAAAERLILVAVKNASVVRFAKVLGADFPLFNNWIEALGRNRKIHPFSDIFMAPVPLGAAVKSLIEVMDQRVTGIIQVSGPQDISYAEAASHLATQLGADPGLVRPVKAAEKDIPAEETPHHTTLCTNLLEAKLDIRIPDAFDVLNDIFDTSDKPT